MGYFTIDVYFCMTIPPHIQSVLDKIFTDTNPICIFLYGSMSRDDQNQKSDYEIGVLYHTSSKVSRSELSKYHQYSELKLYPFTIEDLQNYNLDTPFPKNFYISTLITTATVLLGDNVFKTISLPQITQSDLVELVAFSLGRAYCAVVSSRQNDNIAVTDHLTKSFFYGLQALAYLTNKNIIYSYQELKKIISILNIPTEFDELINHVFNVRFNNTIPNTNLLYKNISFLNMFVMPQVGKYKL
jgi:hypothetical protein